MQILKDVTLATFIRVLTVCQGTYLGVTSIQKGTIDPAELRAVDRNKQSQSRLNQTFKRIYHVKDTGATNRKLSRGRGYVITMVSDVGDVPWWPFILKIFFIVTYFVYVIVIPWVVRLYVGIIHEL